MTSHGVGPFPPAGCHARGTVRAAYVDPDEGQHSGTMRHWHPYTAPTNAPGFSQPRCPTTTGAQSGGGYGLRAPARARVPAVEATVGSRSKFLLLLFAHP